MSQDIFEGLEETKDDGEDEMLLGTPVESSGVSGGSSLGQPSPASQPKTSRLPLPQSPLALLHPAPVPSTSKNPQVHVCPICRRKLKTVRGFAQHTERHRERGEVSTQPTQEVPGDEDQARPSTSTQAESSDTFFCDECKKPLKTKGGFIKHRATHKMKDANRRKPASSDFAGQVLEKTMDLIVQEISAEPNYGSNDSPKIKFLKEFMDKKNTAKWCEFVSSLSEICKFVCEQQTKILPMNQFEEAKKKLNVFLNENGEELKDKLVSVCGEPIPNFLARRLVFRVASKYLDRVQSWVAEAMQQNVPSDDSDLQPTEPNMMTEREEKKFLECLGNIFRAFCRKGIESSSKQWQVQSSCLKEAFVDGQDAMSTASYLNKSNWFSGEENCIVPSEHAVNFFKAVEIEIRRSDDNVQLQEIVERVLENRAALNEWFYLTNAHFSESQSLLFMRELISSFVKTSRQLEEKRKNRAEEKSVQATSVALRGHLQRNYVEKDDCGVEDIL